MNSVVLYFLPSGYFFFSDFVCRIWNYNIEQPPSKKQKIDSVASDKSNSAHYESLNRSIVDYRDRLAIPGINTAKGRLQTAFSFRSICITFPIVEKWIVINFANMFVSIRFEALSGEMIFKGMKYIQKNILFIIIMKIT